MIDLQSEQLISLALAARTPPLSVHVATVWRWATKGVKGILLETLVVGGFRKTSREAVERFIACTTAAANGEDVPSRTSKQREAAIQAAERELDAAGI